MTTSPNYIVSTGDFLAEWMEDEGINAAELARRLNVTRKHVSELLSGKAPLSHTVALNLERVTGVSARIWNQYEATYRGDEARFKANADLEAQYQQARAFPISYLRECGLVRADKNDHAGIVSDLLAVLRVADLSAFDAVWVDAKVAYRKVSVKGDTSQAMATWLALGELHEAKQENLPAFSRDRLELMLPRLRALSAAPDQLMAIDTATELLRDVGVVFCLVRPIPRLGVYGATRWVSGRPLVQLSLRGKSDDHLWFTLFHELGHVLLHGENTVFVAGRDTPEEREADDFAATTFVPPAYQERLPTKRDLAAIQQLAAELGIAPSIVLGQAQRRTGDYAWGHSLKVRFEWQPHAAGKHETRAC